MAIGSCAKVGCATIADDFPNHIHISAQWHSDLSTATWAALLLAVVITTWLSCVLLPFLQIGGHRFQLGAVLFHDSVETKHHLALISSTNIMELPVVSNTEEQSAIISVLHTEIAKIDNLLSKATMPEETSNVGGLLFGERVQKGSSVGNGLYFNNQ